MGLEVTVEPNHSLSVLVQGEHKNTVMAQVGDGRASFFLFGLWLLNLCSTTELQFMDCCSILFLSSAICSRTLKDSGIYSDLFWLCTWSAPIPVGNLTLLSLGTQQVSYIQKMWFHQSCSDIALVLENFWKRFNIKKIIPSLNILEITCREEKYRILTIQCGTFKMFGGILW